MSSAGVSAVDTDLKPAIIQAVSEMKPKSAMKKKLHGREFYESIGSPKMIIAPMVDRSEFVRVSYLYKSEPLLMLSLIL